MASKFQFITELYSRTLTRLTSDYESWTGFLRAACYNYKCPFDEQVLIYAQRPDATAVLELEKWNRQFGRWINAGATGIAVMDEAHGKGRLKHYFDITDTHATRISRPVPIWSMESAYTEPVIETLEATFGTLAGKDSLPDAILSAGRNAVADNMPDYLRDLMDCRGGSMLEDLDALNVEVIYRRALESSVAYMLMTRLSLPAMVYLLPEDFEGIYSFDTPSTINALGIATSDIAEMGLREISRTVMQARREQFFAKDTQIGYDAVKEQNNAEEERSTEHGSDLQSAGGLSPAEPADAARAGDASGQVRGAAETVSQETSPSAVYQPQDQRATGGASGGNRGDGTADGDAGRGADGEGRGRDRGTESRRSPALDGADEQPEAQRGGNGAERPDLQLISEEPAEAGSDALPALADDRANLYHVAAYHHFENGFDDKLDAGEHLFFDLKCDKLLMKWGMEMLNLFVLEYASNAKIPAVVRAATEQDLIATRDWQTAWTTPYAKQLPNKVALHRMDNDELLGLMSYELDEDGLAVEILYLENARHSNANLLHSEGGSKKYVGIAKALFAYAIQISLDAGFDGVLIFKAKTSELLSYYMEKFGARQVASYDPYRLVIWEDAAEDILSTFYYGGA